MLPASLVAIILLIGGGIYAYIVNAQNKEAEALQSLREQWLEALAEQDFERLPTLVTAASLENAGYTEQDFIEKYTNIYSGIAISNMTYTLRETDEWLLDYTASFDTAVGPITDLPYQAKIVEEGDAFKIDWTAELIFPDMLADDKVRYTVAQPLRGEITDRNGVIIAENGERPRAGVVPGQLGTGETRTAMIARIAQALSISPAFIEKQLQQNWVTDETFVPLKTLPTNDTPPIDGVLYDKIASRLYPFAEATAQLIGYVGKVTAEDIEKNPALSANDVIGRTGLEMTFDERLRGQKGGEIYIESANGDKRATIIQNEPQHGETIQLTIDTIAQQSAYDALGSATGTTVLMAPTTGDLLALVSKPSYNPNLFVTGISQSQYDVYNNNEDKPFISRFSARYAPGSTFKPITAAIGIEAGTLQPTEALTIPDMKWQPDNSWGSYFVTRLNFANPVNLETALVKSDNIYFAQQALAMTGEKFVGGLAKLIFTEDLALPLAMEPAQFSNDDSITSDILLADTAYGQGEMLISPIQMTSIYSVLANDGQLAYPRLVMDTEPKTKSAFSSETIATIEPSLVKVVTQQDGTGHVLNVVPNVAAKTGTAELKATQEGRGIENSLILAHDTAASKYVAVSIVEHHQEVGKSAAELLIPVLQQLQ